MAGMLSILNPQYRDPRQDELEEERLLNQRAQMDGFQQARHATLAGGRMLGKGIGSLVAAATGVDPRSPAQRNAEAIEAAKREVAQLGFDPEDPKTVDAFWGRVVQILLKKGLTMEAMAVRREWQDERRQSTLAAKQNRELDLKTEELERNKARDARIDARAGERIAVQMEALKAKLGAAASPIGRMLKDWYDTTDPFAKQQLENGIRNAAAGKVIVENLGGRLILRDATTLQIIAEDEVTPRPVNDAQQSKLDQAGNKAITAYETDKSALQQAYSAAVDLYNDPGLKHAVGVFAGLASQTTPENASSFFNLALRKALTLGQDGQAVNRAIAKMRQVQGNVFISALKELKSASPTGASGLGQLTEVEGVKIQNAKAALDPQQGYESYRGHLAQYVAQLEQSSRLIDDAARRSGIEGLTVKPLQTTPLGGATSAPSAPAAPAQAAPAPSAAPSEDRVRVKMPDGSIGTIPRTNLEAAKVRGAVEIK